MRRQIKKERLLVFALQNTKTDQYISIDEFQLELDRLKYIKKALSNYENGANPNLPLFITHFIILNNIFSCDTLNQILFSEIPEKHWIYLKTILVWLNILVTGNILKLTIHDKMFVKLNKIKTCPKLLKDLECTIKV